MGMTGGQQSTLACFLAGLNYEYTWAVDFSHADATTGIFYNMSAWTTNQKVSTGIRLALNDTVTDTGPAITFREGDLGSFSSIHSNGSSGNDIPDEAIPDTGSTNGINGNGVGHPGRYFSIVVTIDKFDVNVAHSSGVSEINMIHSTDSGGANYFLANLGGAFADTGIKFVNGVAGTVSNQAGYNAILGKTTILTWDHASAYTVSNPDDNPDKISLYPSYQGQMDMDLTLHGYIYSNVPPEPFTLPVEITNPTVGSGPA